MHVLFVCISDALLDYEAGYYSVTGHGPEHCWEWEIPLSTSRLEVSSSRGLEPKQDSENSSVQGRRMQPFG